VINAAISPSIVGPRADETVVEVADDELLGESGLRQVRKMQDQPCRRKHRSNLISSHIYLVDLGATTACVVEGGR
jgi:hypothetical protein